MSGMLAPLAYIRRRRDDRRRYGWKGLLKREGWKPFAIFVVFYLIRDLILYVLIPVAVVAGLWK
jgi:hypothetical protein